MAVLDCNIPCGLPLVPSRSIQKPDSGATQRGNAAPPTMSTLVPPIVLKAPADVTSNVGVSSSKFSLSTVVAWACKERPMTHSDVATNTKNACLRETNRSMTAPISILLRSLDYCVEMLRPAGQIPPSHEQSCAPKRTGRTRNALRLLRLHARGANGMLTDVSAGDYPEGIQLGNELVHPRPGQPPTDPHGRARRGERVGSAPVQSARP